MSSYDTFVFLAAEYDDLAAAEADYDAVKALYYEIGLIDTFDAAVLTKSDSGDVKIVKKHEQPTRKGGWIGAGLGLAAGAAIVLFPAAAIGGGLLAGTTAGGAAIGALAGHVSKGMSRKDLREVGEQLDNGNAGLIVVAAADIEKKIDQVLATADKMIRKEIKADRKELEKELDAAEKSAAAESKD